MESEEVALQAPVKQILFLLHTLAAIRKATLLPDSLRTSEERRRGSRNWLLEKERRDGCHSMSFLSC